MKYENEVAKLIVELEESEGAAVYLPDSLCEELLNKKACFEEFNIIAISKGYSLVQIENIECLAFAKKDETFEYVREYMKYNMFDIPYRETVAEIIEAGGYFNYFGV
ncbi:hypothetical protein [Clostridium magnum]|uniref:Uncharacterized protein n=1 Tax=Clostridium magnum DSM 2767 TaxID=1121326 RepID=A0A162TSG2_9CLOT|nr:hypothetical protein [Clostridium magnum]KZL88387.1 hypothetical protein CLMAG_63140 [Clostridium magnum DSM 2767]KZL88409.1 hypothetical protein CLMAG_63360 [Clostridium magnum DSM 2767]KZL93004.1 hypothetical protein CLMAG_28180 [Clostridium magnum DSM 2767]SHJ46896.1 hypothetical protein SAMN02745944_06019 [Clostridium magnum DSM 2767]